MALDPKVKATIVGEDQTKPAFDSAQKNAESFGDKLKDTLNKPFELLKGLLAVEMVRVVGEFFKSSVEAAAESEAAWSRVGQAVQNAGIAFQGVQTNLKETFATISEQTRFSQDEIASAFAEVLNVSNNYSGSVANLGLITNLAVAKQIDLSTAAQLVGRVMDGNTSMLKRYGIIVRDGQDAMQAMRAQFSGFAERDGASLQGRLAQISNEWGEFKIALGEAITGSDSAAASANTLVDALKGLSTWVEDNRGNIGGFIGDLKSMASEIGYLAKALTNTDGSPWTHPIGYLLKYNTDRRSSGNWYTGQPAANAGDDPGANDPGYQAALAAERARSKATADEQIATNDRAAKENQRKLDADAAAKAAAKELQAMKEQLSVLADGRDLVGLTAKDYEHLGELQYKLEQLVKDTNLPLKERVEIQKQLQKFTDDDHKRAEDQLKMAQQMAELEKKGISVGALLGASRVAGSGVIYDNLPGGDDTHLGGVGVGKDGRGGAFSGFRSKYRIDGRATAAALPTSGAGASPLNDDFNSFGRELTAGTNEANASLVGMDTSLDSLGRTLGRVRGGALKDFFGDWEQGIADVIAGHESLGQAVLSSARKAIGGSIAAEGQATLLKAAAAAAEGWSNPVKFLEAAKLFAVGSAELALGATLSGGGGGGGGSSSSGVSAAGFSQTQSQTGGSGKVTVILRGNGISFANPDELNALRDAMQSLNSTRDLEFLVEGNG